MKTRFIAVIFIFLTQAYCDNQFGASYYPFQHKKTFRMVKDFDLGKNDKLILGLPIIPLEIGHHTYHNHLYSPDTSITTINGRRHVSIGSGVFIEYAFTNSILLKTEYNILFSPSPDVFGYQRLEAGLSYKIWSKYNFGLSLAYQYPQEALSPRYPSGDYREIKGLNKLEIGITLNSNLEDSWITKGINGLYLMITGAQLYRFSQ